MILKPIWTYSLQLWGTAAISNMDVIQRFQNKCLRMILKVGWYHTNDEMHTSTLK